MNPASGMNVKNLFRAMRLPFVAASALPFIFGSILETDGFDTLDFLLGFIGVIATHLSANLINDHADSKSGRDWNDKTYYGMFGGSKLIQQGVLSELFYYKLAVFFLALAGICFITLSITLQNFLILKFFLLIAILGWSYSQSPLRLSYRMAGEPVVFLLFGPALVMGGYFIQNQIFPDARSFILSLPFGFLTTALLFINEVPDFDTDIKVGKKTWVSLSGKKNAHVVYAILVCFAYFYLALSVSMGYLARQSLFAIAGIFFSAKAYMTLKNDFGNKENLLAASKMTIAGQLVTSLVLIYTQIYLR